MARVFQFSSSAPLERLTGRKAFNLEELRGLIAACTDSSIFYHTFSAFRKFREIKAPYTNDFSLWVSVQLNEKALAEKMMAVDLCTECHLEDLRGHLVQTIDAYRQENPRAFEKRADEPFYLMDVTRVVYLTDKFAHDLSSFRRLLGAASIDSLYYHFIEARMHNESPTDDFSPWIAESLGLADLAERIRRLDIHAYTLEELQERICGEIDEYVDGKRTGPGKTGEA